MHDRPDLCNIQRIRPADGPHPPRLCSPGVSHHGNRVVRNRVVLWSRLITGALVASRVQAVSGVLVQAVSGVLVQAGHAQPPQPAGSDRPPLTAAQVNALIGGPTLITLRRQGVTPQALFEEVAAQSGVDLHFYPNVWEPAALKTPLNASINRQPFWLAMRTLTTRAGVHVGAYGYRPDLTIMPRGDMALRGVALMSGPFLIVAHSLQQTLTLPDLLATDSAIADATQVDFKLALSVFIDPKLRVISYGPTFKLEEAGDEKGNSLLLADAGRTGAQELYTGGLAPSYLNLAADLKSPPGRGKRLVRLRGTVHVFAVTKTDVLQVANAMTAKDIEKAVPQVTGDKLFAVHGVKKVGTQYEVQMSITPRHTMALENISQQEHQRTYFLHEETFRRVRLLDDQGRDLPFFTFRTGGGGNGVSAYTAIFNPGVQGAATATGEPAKVVWAIPVETHEVAVPFEFTNLPLP